MKTKKTAASNLMRAWHRAGTGMGNAAPRPLVPSIEAAASLERSRLDNLRLRRRRISLSAVIDPCVEMMGPFVLGRGQTLSVSGSTADMQVDADPARLCQVLKHLILNATKFSAGGAEIAVRAARDGADAVIVVVDSGIGIDAQRLDSIFSPYLVRHAATATRSGELGLGLHVARKLAEAHGGSLLAASAGEGFGSEFTLRIPCVDAAGAPAARSQPRPSSRSDSAFTAA